MTCKKNIVVALGALALMSTGFAAHASSSCPRPRETQSFMIAAVQQQLMVAALSCKLTGSYNAFVIDHRRDLRRSDATLRAYFNRGHGGITAYHAYKTKLANAASLRSLRNIKRYCADAHAIFAAAYDRSGEALAWLMAAPTPAAMSAPMPDTAGCDYRTAERARR